MSMTGDRDVQTARFLECLALVVGNIVGSGVFLLPASTRAVSGRTHLGLDADHRRRAVPRVRAGAACRADRRRPL